MKDKKEISLYDLLIDEWFNFLMNNSQHADNDKLEAMYSKSEIVNIEDIKF